MYFIQIINSMKIYRKIGLYLSSFMPLFVLIIIKELIEILNANWSFNFLNSFVLGILTIFTIYGIMSLIVLFKELNNEPVKIIKLISKTNTTDQHFLGYFSLFVLFAVSFEIEMYSMALIFFTVLTFIGIVYIRNDMYYINPLLNILGYSFYEIKYENENNDIVQKHIFFKGKLKISCNYYLIDKYNNLFFLKKL